MENNDHSEKRKIVLGLGNTLNRDEGLGVYALKDLENRLAGSKVDPELEFLDGGVLGLNLLPLVEEASHILVLDAINARKEPGTVIEMKKEEIPLYTGIKMSDHQITFQEVLGLASFRDKLPDNLHLVGIQPDDISIGVEISDTVQASMEEVLQRSEAVLKAWNLVQP
ncbi:MAG: HyaD/HybD family hydrogenase maturation endopeptidase [Anaerolineales bacterium]